MLAQFFTPALMSHQGEREREREREIWREREREREREGEKAYKSPILWMVCGSQEERVVRVLTDLTNLMTPPANPALMLSSVSESTPGLGQRPSHCT